MDSLISIYPSNYGAKIFDYNTDYKGLSIYLYIYLFMDSLISIYPSNYSAKLIDIIQIIKD